MLLYVNVCIFEVLETVAGNFVAVGSTQAVHLAGYLIPLIICFLMMMKFDSGFLVPFGQKHKRKTQLACNCVHLAYVLDLVALNADVTFPIIFTGKSRLTVVQAMIFPNCFRVWKEASCLYTFTFVLFFNTLTIMCVLCRYPEHMTRM